MQNLFIKMQITFDDGYTIIVRNENLVPLPVAKIFIHLLESFNKLLNIYIDLDVKLCLVLCVQ